MTEFYLLIHPAIIIQNNFFFQNEKNTNKQLKKKNYEC